MISSWRFVIFIRPAVVLALASAVLAFGVRPLPVQAQTAANNAFVQQLYRARAGNLDAQLFVAKSYANGEIVDRDLQQAIAWYLRAAKKGNLEAQFQAAKIFHAGAAGVKRQPGAAVKLYKAAAKRGHPNAQNWLGYAYQHGHGVVKDNNIAADWYKNASAQGLADAQNNLALLYLIGKGVGQDHATAAKWFQKAVDQDHGFAMNNLGGMYEVGWGVDRDLDRATQLYTSASLTGNTSAVENLKRLGAPVPLEAQQKLNQDKQRLQASIPAGTDPQAEQPTDASNRGDAFTDLPDLDASDDQFDDWLARQTDNEQTTPVVRKKTNNGTFDFFNKNWNKVTKQRKRRKIRTQENSLR